MSPNVCLYACATDYAVELDGLSTRRFSIFFVYVSDFFLLNCQSKTNRVINFEQISIKVL